MLPALVTMERAMSQAKGETTQVGGGYSKLIETNAAYLIAPNQQPNALLEDATLWLGTAIDTLQCTLNALGVKVR